MLKKLLALALALSLLLTSCAAPQVSQSISDAAPAADAPADPTVPMQRVAYRAQLAEQPIEPLPDNFVQGINSLGFHTAPLLFNESGNLAFSPASLALALCLTREGAGGDTKSGITKTLGLSDLTDEQIRNASRSLMWRANTGGMEAANAVWLSQDCAFSEPFLTAAMQYYFADAYPLVSPGTKDAVNAWVSEKTHERIKSMLEDEVDNATPILLMGALTFLGDWELPFAASDTADGDFAAPDGSVSVPFMGSERFVPYYADKNFSMVSLPFKSEDGSGQYAMAFILPAKGKSLERVLSRLDADTFKEALAEAQEQTVSIRLPKFGFEYFAELRDTLSAQGMGQMFTREADFSAMTEQPGGIFFTDVLHKCYVRVDELGAEAAAATVIMNRLGAAEQTTELPQFNADRPFLFAIYSLEDGAIAFLGAVNNPAK